MDNNQQTNIIDNINVGFNSEENIEKVIRELDEAGIKYEIFRHAPVFTVEEANALGLPNPEAGAKNLFLRDNKKKLYCLVVVKDDREVKIKEIQEKINSRPLSFASEKDLFEKMKLIRGSVTPLGAINNEEKDVENTLKLREVLKTLPVFCRDYFRAIEPTTSTKTRISYAYDIRVFFRFLKEQNPLFKDTEITDFPLSILDDIQAIDIEEFQEYLKVYDSEENDKRILISGCSHKGICDIADRYRPDILIGGFHFKSLKMTAEDRRFLEQTAEQLMAFPTRYYTCHCTGAEPYAYLKQRMGEQLQYLSVGTYLEY